METKRNKKLLVLGTILVVCFIAVEFSNSIQGSEERYEIRPEITLPEYRTDTARAIDAYERVMDRFMNLTEQNLTSVNADVKSIAKKLILMDSKLTDISIRMAKIEMALGVEQIEKPIGKAPEAANTSKPDLQN